MYSDGSALASRIVKQLVGTVVVAAEGAELKKVEASHWNLDFKSSNQHQALLDELAEADFQPTDVVYCCGLAASPITLGLLSAREDINREASVEFLCADAHRSCTRSPRRSGKFQRGHS